MPIHSSSCRSVCPSKGWTNKDFVCTMVPYEIEFFSRTNEETIDDTTGILSAKPQAVSETTYLKVRSMSQSALKDGSVREQNVRLKPRCVQTITSKLPHLDNPSAV